MSAVLELLFWLLFFGLIVCMWLLSELVERKRRPRSPWLRKFHERNEK